MDEIYKKDICFRVTGIQNGDMQTQLFNFVQKIVEYASFPVVIPPNNWQESLLLLKKHLQSLPKNKKQVIFIDELPWIATPRSKFIQLLAHLWNDCISKEKHFILVICGSATSWINAKILNDKGGFHNRVSHHISLSPFTLSETKAFLESKRISLTDSAIAEIYMAMGGIPYYLDLIKRGESPTTTIDRLFFAKDGPLRNEYVNLYSALFDNHENHEAIVRVLASAQSGLTREDIIQKSKIDSGGPYTRAIYDLIISGFVMEEVPYGRKKRGALYRLVDQYSSFYHRFIRPLSRTKEGSWALISGSQPYKIWKGYAFENLCLKHINEIKTALGISSVYTETSNFRHIHKNGGFQIDLLIDRKDDVINLCECKFYNSPYTITKDYALKLLQRKELFKEVTKTQKQVFTTFITNYPLVENKYSLDVVDVAITIENLLL